MLMHGMYAYAWYVWYVVFDLVIQVPSNLEVFFKADAWGPQIVLPSPVACCS